MSKMMVVRYQASIMRALKANSRVASAAERCDSESDA